MIEVITMTAKIAVNYEELVEDYKDRIIDTEDLSREVNPDLIIDSVIEDYFADIEYDASITFEVPAETIKDIKKKMKKILF